MPLKPPKFSKIYQNTIGVSENVWNVKKSKIKILLIYRAEL